MLLSLWIVLALGVFAVGCGAKALRYLRMPMHVRWELYPVAHEKGRAHYGGSYFEEVDWWTKPREVEKLAEVRTILEEVLTLKAVREHNRPLWLPSLLFHYGLYALCLLGLALAAGAVAIRLGLPAGPLAGVAKAVPMLLRTCRAQALLPLLVSSTASALPSEFTSPQASLALAALRAPLQKVLRVSVPAPDSV